MADAAVKLGLELESTSKYMPSSNSFQRIQGRHLVHYHAERKAVALLLEKNPQENTFEIWMNLSMCKNCHWFFECLSSHLSGRTFRVMAKDTLHNFQGGTCSCGLVGLELTNAKDSHDDLRVKTSQLKEFINGGSWNAAQQLWLQMQNLPTLDIKAFSVMLQWFMKNPSLSSVNRIVGIWSLINMMKGLQVKPDYGIWAVLLQCYCKDTTVPLTGVIEAWNELNQSGEVNKCNTTILSILNK